MKALDDYDDDIKEEEPEQASSTPSVGEKRPREEDEPEDQSNSNFPIKHETRGESETQSFDTAVNGSVGGMNALTNGVAGVGNAAGANTGQFDALYIGDLQWVRLLCRLPLYMYINLKSRVFFLPDSGRLMKMFVKLQQNTESTWTTKILRFRNIRSTAKAKGKSCIHGRGNSGLTSSLLVVSIAYIECHNADNATVLKNWFDNK